MNCVISKVARMPRGAGAAGALIALAIAAPAWAQGSPPGPLTLAQAIDAVLARYPSMDAARAAIDAARARTMESNADRLPQVSGQAGYTYNSLRPYVAFSFPGGPNGAIYENVQNAYGVSVTARQLLTDFGRTDKIVDMARSGQITAQDALEDTRHQLGYQTIQSFYGVLLLRSSADVAREEIGALEEALRIAEKKFGAGSATKFDVLTTQVRLSNARNHLTDTLASLEKQENGLRQLLGRQIGAPLEVAGDFDAEAPAIPESMAIADGINNRPEMKLARDDEQTAHLRQDAADRGNRPTLAAQVTGGVENGVVPNLYDNRGYVTAGLSLEVPILTGRRVTGDRLEAEAGVRSAQARERELSETITTDVANAYSDLNAAKARLGSADTLVAQAKEALALAETRYANGVITNFELLDAQSSFRSAELSRLQARYDCVLARQAVARAAGVAPQP
ncbi:MAG TPA: TolC family protein [Opitutaceae bacterium]|nr:TolC family protein [Opitutaceae bacterium]